VTTTIPVTTGRGGGDTRVSAAPPALGMPSAPALPEDLELLLRGLRLPHIRRHAPEVLATAKAQRWGPAEVLKALLTEEAAGRARSALATRRAAAAFPTGKTFDAWMPHVSSVPLPTQQALQTLEWIGRRKNLVVCGPSGRGKTFLLEDLRDARLVRSDRPWRGVFQMQSFGGDGDQRAQCRLETSGRLTARECSATVVAAA
jgi:hypothetical protein